MEWIDYALSIIAGLAATIPLVLKLVEYVRIAVREKNWRQLLKLVMTYMAKAETKFETGAERKEWVLAMVAASAEVVNYDIDLAVVGQMIDDVCDMSNVVNAPAEKAGE